VLDELTIKPTRCTNFSNLFLEYNFTYFGQFLCPSSVVFTVNAAVVYVIQVCWQLASRIRTEPSWSCSQAVWHVPLLCVQRKTRNDGQRNCPKHVKFYSKNKFEKLVHLVGFIIRIYHDARSAERQIFIGWFTLEACWHVFMGRKNLIPVPPRKSRIPSSVCSFLASCNTKISCPYITTMLYIHRGIKLT